VNPKLTYLLVDLLTVLVPFMFSFHPGIKFNKYFSSFLRSNLFVSVIFIIWDIIFTAKGVWGFNPEYCLGITIFNLPIEEILFFICIPFSCVFTYHLLAPLLKIKWKSQTEDAVIIFIAFSLFLAGFLFVHNIYSAVTFFSTGIFLLLLKYIAKAKWIPGFIVVYLFLLLPFFTVNGLLTGSGLNHPVVWYNPSEIIGIRILTVPIEDLSYGFELLLLNIYLFEKTINKS